MAERVLYFLSDLHLGDGTGADRFLYPAELIALLERVEAEPGAELVLVGDILELWSADLGSVLTRHSPLVRRLLRLAERRPVTYVVGNHDALPGYAYLGTRWAGFRVVEEYTARVDGGLVVAIHGHQYDPFNQVRTGDGEVHLPFSRHLAALAGHLERAGLGEAVAGGRDWLERLAAAAGRWEELARAHPDSPAALALRAARHLLGGESPGQRGYPLGESRYREAALERMRQGARWVVMGHTHHPEVVAAGRKTYVNTGCWCWDRYPPTYARLAAGSIDLMDARDHRPYRPEFGPPAKAPLR